MSKFTKVLVVSALVVVVLSVGGCFYIKSMPIPEIEVGETDFSGIKDGIYLAEYSACPVKAVIKTRVTDNRIVGITIEEHQNGLGSKAENIIDTIIGAQSLDVDAVSGATLSSNVIRKAIEISLKSEPIQEDN